MGEHWIFHPFFVREDYLYLCNRSDLSREEKLTHKTTKGILPLYIYITYTHKILQTNYHMIHYKKKVNLYKFPFKR
jgi:hypothetical protein